MCFFIVPLTGEVIVVVMGICLDDSARNLVGKSNSVIEVFNDIEMPEELIMNTSADKLKDYLRSKKKKRFMVDIDTPII